MDSGELKKRTKKFAIDVIKLVEDFPKAKSADVVGRQLIKSATKKGYEQIERGQRERRCKTHGPI